MNMIVRRIGQSGQSLLEFAAVSTILFLMVIGIFEFSRAYYYYSMVTNAAQEGARYGITDQNPDCIKQAALSHVVLVDLTTTDVTDPSCPDSGGCVYGNRISLVVSYTFNSIVSFLPSLPMSGNATMRIMRTYNSGGTCQ